jgi:uncharacterized protein (UPF0147 family)
VTGIEVLILKGLNSASGGLLSALVKELVKQGDKRLRGTKFERRLREVVLSAIVSAVDASADEPLGELRDHTLQVVAESPASAGIAAKIVLPPEPDSNDDQASWIADVRQQLIAGGADLETLPIDVGRFIALLPRELWRALQTAGNEPDSPLAHLVTHLQNVRTQELVGRTPEATMRLVQTEAEIRQRRARGKAVESFRQAVRAAGDELPYLAIRSRLHTEGRTLSDLYMAQRLVERSRMSGDGGGAIASAEMSMAQLLRVYDHLIVVAAGGQGKSTLAHHICATIDRDSDLVPILVTARGLAAVREGWPHRLSEVAAEELRHTVPPDLFNEPPTPGTKWLLLVDGLDEVGFVGARTTLIDDLLRLAAEGSSQFKVAITSRPLAELSRLESGGFRTLDLLPVSPDEPRRFAQAWFSAGSSPDPERGDALLRWLDDRGVPYRTSPLLLTMAALLFERDGLGADVLGSIQTRVDVYDAFIDTLLNKDEEDDDTLRSFTLPWSQRLPERGPAVAARLWEERLGLLEHLADWRQRGNDGDLVSEAVASVRERELVPAGLPARWLTERITGLLRQTGLVAGRGNLDFVHETLREYLAASMLARQVGPDDPEALGYLEGNQGPDATDVLAFAVSIWAANGRDVGHLLNRALEVRGGILVAATALADRVPVKKPLAERIASEMVDGSRRETSSFAFFGDSFRLGLILERAIAQPQVHAAVRRATGDRATRPEDRARLIRLLHAPSDRDALYQILTDEAQPRTVRIAAADALRAVGKTKGIAEHVTRMIEQRGTDRRTRAEGALLLVDIGESEMARKILAELGADPDVYDSPTWNAVAEGLIKLGDVDELIGLAQNARLPGTARVHYIEELLSAGHKEAALSAALAVVYAAGESSQEVSDHDRLRAANVLGTNGHNEDAMAVVRNVAKSADFIVGASELRTWASPNDLLDLVRDNDVAANLRLQLAKDLQDTEFADQAVAVLEAMGADIRLDDGQRVDAAVAAIGLRVGGRASGIVDSLARDPALDVIARADAATALWEEDAPPEAAAILLDILRDPGLGGRDVPAITTILCRLGHDEELQQVIRDPLVEAPTRFAIARALGGCGLRDQAVTFMWSVCNDPTATPGFRQAAISALTGLGQAAQLLEWARDPARLASARLEVAIALLRSNWQKQAAEILVEILRDPRDLSRSEMFRASASLDDARSPEVARELADDPKTDEAIARGAILALRHLELVDDIVAVAENERVPEAIRLEAIEALSESGRVVEAETAARLMCAGCSSNGRTLLYRGLALAYAGLSDDAAPELLSVARDGALDDKLRYFAARGLRRVDRLDDAMGTLVELVTLHTTSAAVAAAALDDLVDLVLWYQPDEARQVAELMLRIVSDEQRPTAVRETAAKKLGTRDLTKRLTEFDLQGQLLDQFVDPRLLPEVRVALADAAVELGEGELVVSTVASFARDAELPCEVRLAAITELRELGGPGQQWRTHVRKLASAVLRALAADPSAVDLVATVAGSPDQW